MTMPYRSWQSLLLLLLSAALNQSYGWVVTFTAKGAGFESSMASFSVQQSASSSTFPPRLCVSSTRRYPSSSTTALRLSWFQDTFSNFLRKREGDFVPLDTNSENEYGPGPVLILYNLPTGIDQDEIHDMLSDGAPVASKKGIQLIRLDSSSKHTNPTAATLLESSLGHALEQVANGEFAKTPSSLFLQAVDDDTVPVMNFAAEASGRTSILFFSGFRNDEMMATYRILAGEIYDESGGWVACAKAVPNAMDKSLQQVLEEISGDHLLAMELDGNDEKQ